MTDDDEDFELPDFSAHEGFAEMGKWGLSIYRAVRRDGGTQNEAFSITAAFFAGMNKAAQGDDVAED